MRQLEAEKFELQYKYTKQKYEVKSNEILMVTLISYAHQKHIFWIDRFLEAGQKK